MRAQQRGGDDNGSKAMAISARCKLQGMALGEFGPQECANFFAHCGYSATPTS